MDQRSQFSAQLQPHVGGDRKEPTENTWRAQGRCSWRRVSRAHVCMYTRVGGRVLCQRAVLSDSSSESLLSVTECRLACSRGLRRSVDPSSMWMEGISKWTRSASWQRERELKRGFWLNEANCGQTLSALGSRVVWSF